MAAMSRRSIDQPPARFKRVSFWLTAFTLANAIVWLTPLLVTLSASGLQRAGRVWEEARLVIQREPGQLGRAMPEGRCESCGYDLGKTGGKCPQCGTAAGGVRGPGPNTHQRTPPPRWRRGR